MEQFIKGGAFLIDSISPKDVFTPEDFNEEQKLIAKAVSEFVVGSDGLPAAQPAGDRGRRAC